MNQAPLHILDPVTISQFLNDYWEHSPLHIARTESNHFSEALSIGEIESLLSVGGQFFPDIQLVSADADVPVGDYTDEQRRVVSSGVWRHFNAGATLVINGGQHRFTGLADLCRAVSREFCYRSQANVYLSPAGNQGFKPHYDTHDVFVLQVSGSKLFRFYPSQIELPFTEDTFPSDVELDSNVQEEILLTAGDTLYIPRGVVHDAVAQNDGPSLHVTLGVFPLVLRDVLQEAVQLLAEKDVTLRRSTNLRKPADAELMAKLTQSIASVDSALISDAQSRLLDDVVVGMHPSSAGRVSSQRIEPDDVVRIDPEAIINVEPYDSGVKLRVVGQVLEFPEAFVGAVLRLTGGDAVRLSELPGLDEYQATALLDKLQTAGCIRRSPLDE